ncbi:hypothetical protein BDQ17DRAFT_1430591 [Cyathus striatus]|nr:hypothetical protein BDQ17DRAFT_1430591 [Cyathus striatus]
MPSKQQQKEHPKSRAQKPPLACGHKLGKPQEFPSSETAPVIPPAELTTPVPNSQPALIPLPEMSGEVDNRDDNPFLSPLWPSAQQMAENLAMATPAWQTTIHNVWFVTPLTLAQLTQIVSVAIPSLESPQAGLHSSMQASPEVLNAKTKK